MGQMQSLVCDRCHLNPSTIEMTFAHAATGRQFPQHFCATCFDELLQHYPEVSQELKDAETQGRPAEIKSLPSELSGGVSKGDPETLVSDGWAAAANGGA